MIRDRGNIKWTSIMLPEHVQALKEALIDQEKIPKPILDEQEIQEIEMLILEGMEFDCQLAYTIYHNGFTRTIIGRTHYIDHLKHEIRIKDNHDEVHRIGFDQLINVQRA
ncbi:MAG TPA: YolD-like family protein [Chondromyces sp.]|nr:YolD-like family protein [Chondromyces sp.]